MRIRDQIIEEIHAALDEARQELGFEPLSRIATRAIEVTLIGLVKRIDARFSSSGGSMRPFPTQAETFEAAGVLLTLVRGGSPDYKPGDYVHAGLCVADFAVQQIMQTSGEQFNTANYATDEDALVAVQSACDPGASAAALPAAINWKQLMQMMWGLLKPIIDDLLKAQPVA
jgi:hypothetical protein